MGTTNFYYPHINPLLDIIYLHSAQGDLVVGNGGSPASPAVAFLYNNGPTNMLQIHFKQINYPGAPTTSVYGVWDNDDLQGSIYTIVGGYSTPISGTPTPIGDIYNLNYGIPYPIGSGYIANYDKDTDTFSDWTTVSLPPGSDSNLLLHVQGISKVNNIYFLSPVVGYTTKTYIQGYLIKATKIPGSFIFTDYIPIDSFDGSPSIVTSVASNHVVGFPGPNNVYQAKIE